MRRRSYLVGRLSCATCARQDVVVVVVVVVVVLVIAAAAAAFAYLRKELKNYCLACLISQRTELDDERKNEQLESALFAAAAAASEAATKTAQIHRSITK